MSARAPGSGAEPWMDLDGNPLKYQDGDQVKVLREPHSPGMRDGWVRGYDLVTGMEPGYEVFRLGERLCWVKESALELVPENLRWDHAHYPGCYCGICDWNGKEENSGI